MTTRDNRRRNDREILRLALPALGALVAEPLYVLSDTAVVGHLGTAQLGGLAVASSILLTVHAVFIFLAYGTTGAVARLLGAGEEREAAHQAVQGLWLGGLIGVAVAAVTWPVAPGLVEALGAEGTVRANAVVYLRISLIGMPALLMTLAGTGYLRGLQDTRTPLAVAVGTALLNLVLEVVLIYGLDQGIGASALTTVVAQVAGAAAYLARTAWAVRHFAVPLRPEPASIRRLLVVGRDLLIRTAALRGALVVSTAVAARRGQVALGAHQIAFEVWNFLALVLDAIAIAGQAMTGRLLGEGNLAEARAVGRRMIEWGVIGGVAVGALVAVARPWLPELFTDDRAVQAVCAFLLWWVALVQPVNAVVFVLDGVLIGAGDQRFLAGAMVLALLAFLPVAGLVLVADLGIGWLWAALVVLMLARLVALTTRFRGTAWAVPGAVRR